MPNSFVYKQLPSNKLAVGKQDLLGFLWGLQGFFFFLRRIDTAVQPIKSLHLLQVGFKILMCSIYNAIVKKINAQLIQSR